MFGLTDTLMNYSADKVQWGDVFQEHVEIICKHRSVIYVYSYVRSGAKYLNNIVMKINNYIIVINL